MKTLITATAWRGGSTLPFCCATDFYYTKVAQRFYDLLWFTPLGKDRQEYWCMETALVLAHYLEDVISDFGLWRTFTSCHQKLYGKPLPFYHIGSDDYYPDEINREDVYFLLWTMIQKSKESTFFNPENPYLREAGDKIYAEMEKLFEQAPINDEITGKLNKKEMLQDFFYIKYLCIHMMKSSYLLLPFEEKKRAKVEEEMDALLDNMSKNDFTYAVDSLMAFGKKTGPLNLYAKDWLSSLLAHQGMTEESQWVAAIETRPYNIYHVKQYDTEKLVLETAEGEELIVPRDSFNQLPDSTLEENSHILTALAKYRDIWQINGLSTWTNNEKAFELQQEQYSSKGTEENRRILKANGGYPLLYFKDYNEMHAWLAKHIGFDNKFKKPKEVENRQYWAAYIPAKGDISVLPDAALAIKDERNPYYNQQEAVKEALNYLVSTDMIQDEMLHYLIANRMLPDAAINSLYGPERGKQLVQENMDFIARFMRNTNY